MNKSVLKILMGSLSAIVLGSQLGKLIEGADIELYRFIVSIFFMGLFLYVGIKELQNEVK